MSDTASLRALRTMLEGVVTTRAAASLVAMAVGIILLNGLVLEEGWIEAGSSAPASASDTVAPAAAAPPPSAAAPLAAASSVPTAPPAPLPPPSPLPPPLPPPPPPPPPSSSSSSSAATGAVTPRQRVLSTPCKCRSDFAERANDLGLTHYACEIGVNDGVFARYALPRGPAAAPAACSPPGASLTETAPAPFPFAQRQPRRVRLGRFTRPEAHRRLAQLQAHLQAVDG